jgi:hypothetical protein
MIPGEDGHCLQFSKEDAPVVVPYSKNSSIRKPIIRKGGVILPLSLRESYGTSRVLSNFLNFFRLASKSTFLLTDSCCMSHQDKDNKSLGKRDFEWQNRYPMHKK